MLYILILMNFFISCLKCLHKKVKMKLFLI